MYICVYTYVNTYKNLYFKERKKRHKNKIVLPS